MTTTYTTTSGGPLFNSDCVWDSTLTQMATSQFEDEDKRFLLS